MLLLLRMCRVFMFIAGEQKWARKTNLDWKGVTPFAQACNVYNGDSESILRAVRMVFQLECKESVKFCCTETHVGVTFDWLLHMHGCHMKDKWLVKITFQKGQELAKLSKHKARNLREREVQDAQGQLGWEERKTKNWEWAGREFIFLYTAVHSTSPALHNHRLLLVFIYFFLIYGFSM